MRAVRQAGPTEASEVQDIPVPDVEPGGVRVRRTSGRTVIDLSLPA